GLIPTDWPARLPNHAVPFTSTILFLVRAGNPKQIRDWGDLVKPGVVPIVPNPKTSGNGRYSYLAAWAYALRQPKGDEPAARAFVGKLFKAVPVLLTCENEARLAVTEGNGQVELVTPSVSIRAENPVAVIDKVAVKRGTTDVATAYLKFLYTPEAQEIAARH